MCCRYGILRSKNSYESARAGIALYRGILHVEFSTMKIRASVLGSKFKLPDLVGTSYLKRF